MATLFIFARADWFNPVPRALTEIRTALYNHYRCDCGSGDFSNSTKTGCPVESSDQGRVLIEFVAYPLNSKTRCTIASNRLSKPGFNLRMCSTKVILWFLLAGFTILSSAAEFNCPQGEPVLADIGGGVIMRTCRWEKAANVTVRTGPLELVKNGVLILRLETDSNGKLHGQYTVWNDAGQMTENGNYLKGLKEGIWTATNENGDSETFHYRAGVIVEP